jgi:putative transposase
LGLPGRAPPRVEAATKAGLLDLLEQAVQAGWEFRAACQVLELGTVRAYRWLGRRAADELADHRPGGSPLHGLLDWEVAEIVALFHQWGEIDRSHRKLPTAAPTWNGSGYRHRRSGGCWPPRACACAHCRGLAARCASRSPTGWSTPPTRSGSSGTTHFPRAGVAATVIEDLVSRTEYERRYHQQHPATLVAA